MTVAEHLAIKVAILVGLGLSAGCAPDNSEVQGPQLEAEPVSDLSSRGNSFADGKRLDVSQSVPESELWVTLPSRLRFRGLAKVQSASSWGERLARLPKSEQAYLVEVSERYFGSLEFSSREAQRHLIQQGFPMPEEWLAARSLPDAELERLAEDGNLKAQMFMIDRVAQQIGPVRAVRGLTNTPADKALFRRFVSATTIADKLLQTSGSPFAAYLAGRIYSAGTQGNSPEYIASAFQLAEDLGDDRADDFRHNFFQKHPELDANTVMALYSSLKSRTNR